MTELTRLEQMRVAADRLETAARDLRTALGAEVPHSINVHQLIQQVRVHADCIHHNHLQYLVREE